MKALIFPVKKEEGGQLSNYTVCLCVIREEKKKKKEIKNKRKKRKKKKELALARGKRATTPRQQTEVLVAPGLSWILAAKGPSPVSLVLSSRCSPAAET